LLTDPRPGACFIDCLLAGRTLGENPRKGSSLAAIKGCMAEEWGVDIRQLAAKIKNFILNAVQDGEIIQTKGECWILILLGFRIWIRIS
jgi:hypothetical protein